MAEDTDEASRAGTGADGSGRDGDDRDGGRHPGERPGREDPLVAVVADPDRGGERLPQLLGALDADDRSQRLRAALALCLAVEADPDLLDPVVRRLVDRLDGDPPVEVPHALDYLAGRRPRAVDEAVTDLDEERELRAREHLYRSGGGFARSEYLSPSPGDRGVGRTRAAGAEGDRTGGQRVYTDRSPGADFDPSTLAEGGDGTEDDGGDADGTDGGSGDDRRELTRGRLALVTRRLSAVIERSRFDDLSVRSDRAEWRFGDRYRAVGTVADEEAPLALVVFRVPDDDRAAFARALRDALDAWAGVDDHDSVLSVHDWGLRPRPWAALEHTGTALADRDGEALDPQEAVASTVEIAGAVAHAHQRGVVHGALDPATVAYPGARLTERERQRPRVTAVGLARVYADHLGLPEVVDPRYAAPEHYSGRFGSVDHATDVYALGTLLYRLVTGEPPYDGSIEEIRAGVCSDRTPVPGEVDPDLPGGLDQVVRKATATGKLTRYETVTAFRRELQGVVGDGR
ncbi:protein kinase domain-containing protein [Halosimplex halophilum]|uniref:protein kinase domain-containing protein n=1 Tax=Halosimplex halophilum TaxID=2559572 RepID=UPI00107EFB9F|nr:protein kinase [Halosimplex halophilum]